MASATIPISTEFSRPCVRSGSVMAMSTSGCSSVSSESSFGSVRNGSTPSPPCGQLPAGQFPVALPKPPEAHANRRKRLTMTHSGSVTSSVTSSTSEQQRPFSQSFNGFEKAETSSGIVDDDDDKYSAFSNLNKGGQGYTGWSTKVMGNGPFGWSDELLYGKKADETTARTGSSTGSRSPGGASDNSAEDDLNHLRVAAEEPWYKSGHGTWNTSPNRRFVRNFP